MAGWKGQTESTLPGRTGIRVTLFLAASGVIYWSLQGSEFSLRELFRGVPQIVYFFGRMVPPDWSVWDVLWRASMETLQTTIAGGTIRRKTSSICSFRFVMPTT